MLLNQEEHIQTIHTLHQEAIIVVGMQVLMIVMEILDMMVFLQDLAYHGLLNG